MYAAILAGGSGTRFWPLSRTGRPKQFLDLLGGGSLIEATAARLPPLASPEETLVVCGAAHADEVRRRLPALPPANVLVEPAARNTAAAVALAALFVAERDPEGVVAILPSDHHVGDPAAFRAHLAAAEAAAKKGHIVTLGLVPTRPETGYGYIHAGAPVGEEAGRPVHRVSAFVEKPDLDRAKAYLSAGTYYWNAGIFVFRADVMRAELARHRPSVSAPLEQVAGRLHDPEALAAAWAEVESVSIDYAVMEPTDKAAVIPAEFGWSDLGSFASLPEVLPAAAEGNVVVGDAVTVDARRNVIHAGAGRLVAVVGVEDLVVVDAGDAILVCPADRSQEVREVVRRLRERGREDLL